MRIERSWKGAGDSLYDRQFYNRGCVLAVNKGRNSPSAIITRGNDTFLALAAIVGEEMYDRTVPVISVDDEQFAFLNGFRQVVIADDGSIRHE